MVSQKLEPQSKMRLQNKLFARGNGAGLIGRHSARGKKKELWCVVFSKLVEGIE